MPDIAKRLIRFSGVGMTVFTAEIILLSILLYIFDVSYLPAMLATYALVFTASYFGYRSLAFYGTERARLLGYFYFMIIAGLSLVCILLGSLYLVTELGFNEIIARIIIGILTGLLNFFVNAVLNFKVI